MAVSPGGTMNREWHLQHKMPASATEQQRVQWHLEHTRNCSCRPFPMGLLANLTDEQRRQIEDRTPRPIAHPV
jgi:hypothetical protein